MLKGKKRWWLIGTIAAVILLSIAWYLGSPLFIDKTVNEEISSTAVLSHSGTFSGADSFHQVQGEAMAVSFNGKKYLRFEDFQSTNGPDLKVYLSKDLEAKEYISLGDLKGNIGNQNYELQDNVDLEDYKYILIWCERFSVLFGNAELKGFPIVY